MILYLHGFLSTPESSKALMLRDALIARGLGDEYVCPQLPMSPRAAAKLALATAQMEAAENLCLIGSSLGGFYSTWIAEKLGCRAVLLNPSIKPFEDLRRYVGLGPQRLYNSEETVEFKPQYLEELQEIDTPRITQPSRYFLVAATGDELIDYRTMQAKYAGAHERVVQGSDHQLSDFAEHLDAVLAFAGVAA